MQTKLIEGGFWMLGKNMFDNVREAQLNHELACLCVFNDGTTETDTYSNFKYINVGWQMEDSLKHVEWVLCGATERYAEQYPMDQVEMDIKLGLVYSINDVDENGKVKEDAKPMKDIVRFYTGKSRSYCDGEQTNKDDYRGLAYQGYLSYSKLVNNVVNGGCEFKGPKTFKEFSEAVKTGEPFSIQIAATLPKKNTLAEEVVETVNKESEVKEEVIEKPMAIVEAKPAKQKKTERKKLFRLFR